MFHVLILVLLSLALSGCAEFSAWGGRTFYNADCRPETTVKHNGLCAPLPPKGNANAQTTQR